jgi:hypothetical protein
MVSAGSSYDIITVPGAGGLVMDVLVAYQLLGE